MVHVAQQAGPHDVLVGGLVLRCVETGVPDLEHAVVLPGGLGHLPAAFLVVRHHLLDEDVLARLQAPDGHFGVVPQRRRDDDGLDVLLGQHVAPLFVLARRRPSPLHKAVTRFVPALRVDVAHRSEVDELLLALAEQGLAVEAGADEAGLDGTAPPRPAQRGGRAQGHQRGDTCQRLHEVPPAQGDFFGSERHGHGRRWRSGVQSPETAPAVAASSASMAAPGSLPSVAAFLYGLAGPRR